MRLVVLALGFFLLVGCGDLHPIEDAFWDFEGDAGHPDADSPDADADDDDDNDSP